MSDSNFNPDRPDTMLSAVMSDGMKKIDASDVSLIIITNSLPSAGKMFLIA